MARKGNPKPSTKPDVTPQQAISIAYPDRRASQGVGTQKGKK